MREPVWSDVWHLAMTVLGRASIQMQVLAWMVALFLLAIFLEGVRSTFFRRMSPEAHETAATKQRKPSGLPRIGAPKMWNVTEISRTPDGLPKLVAVASQPQHAKKRHFARVTRSRPAQPGIYRRPFYFLRESAPVYDVVPAAAEPEYDEPRTARDGSDLRFAS